MCESPPCESKNFSLFWGSGSTPCWRVMICLEEKCLNKYDGQKLSFLDNEHKSERVQGINPRGQLPAFKHHDTVLNESLGICHYLEDSFPDRGTKLIPNDPKEKALVLQRIYESLNLQVHCNTDIIYKLFFTPPEQLTKGVIDDGRRNLLKELELWEAYLSKHDGDFFLTGANFTLADAVFFPQIAFVARMYSEMGKRFPLLADYYKRLCTRKSIQDTWPPHWKECEGQNLLDEEFDPKEFDVSRFIY